MQIVAGFMAVMGLAIAGIWTRDIISAGQLDISTGRLRAREPGSGSFLLPHWIAEYATAGALVAGAIGLFVEASWGSSLAFVSLGALVYTSINALGWALAQRSRIPYAAPMALGAVGGLVAIIALLLL